MIQWTVALTFVPVDAWLALQGVGGFDQLEAMSLNQALGLGNELGLQLVGDALVVIGHRDLLVLHPGTGQDNLQNSNMKNFPNHPKSLFSLPSPSARPPVCCASRAALRAFRF